MSLMNISSDVIHHIQSFLTLRDILNLEQLNKDFQEISKEPSLWKILCERDNFNVRKTKPTTSLKDLYTNYETIGASESIWFFRYNLKKLCWDVNPRALEIIEQLKTQNIGFISTIETSDSKYSSEILNSLLGLKGDTFEANEKEPVVYMWSKPYISKKKKPKKTFIYLKCDGLLDASFDEFDISKQQRKTMMKLILLLSSTVLLCMNLNDKWIKELNNIFEEIKNPQLFASSDHMRSLLICTRGNNEIPRVFDIFEEIRETSIPSNTPFISCLLNWFGKSLGLKLFPSQKHADDIWACVNEITSPLCFHWPINRWSRMKPNGSLVSSFITSFLSQINVISPPTIEKIISNFSREMLNEELQSTAKFYANAQRLELDQSNPLEMEDFVKKSEKHFQNSLRIFTQSTCEALFSHQVIGEVENYLANAITSHFRNLWLENSQNSEDYCQNIFESCFKWVKALIDSRDFKEMNIKERFLESIDIYLQFAKGTKKYQVMCFCSKIYVDIITSLEPKIQSIADEIMNLIEEEAMNQNEKINEKRKYLQHVGELNMQLQIIENTIHRLTESITARKVQLLLTEEFYQERNLKLNSLGVKLTNDDKETRNRYIQSEESSLKEEIQQFREIEKQLKEYQKQSSF
eukprot:gene7427-11750_t